MSILRPLSETGAPASVDATGLITIKRRADFLRVRGGARWGTPGFLMEAKRRASGAPVSDEPADRAPRATALEFTDRHPARFGFTVTKKLGPAVVRNRIRRRLRELLRQGASAHGLPGCDYVIVARDAALRRPHDAMRHDLVAALAQVNRRLTSPPETGDRPRSRAAHDRKPKSPKP